MNIDSNPQFKKCYIDAIRILTPRDYSEHKLRTKLQDREHDEEIIQQVILYLIEKKLFNEDIYIEARIKGLARKNLSARFIQQKMNQEHIKVDLETIDEILGNAQIEPVDQLNSLIEKKLRSMREFDREKVLRFLISKGHSYSAAKLALNSYQYEQ
jgi:regulatory protein